MKFHELISKMRGLDNRNKYKNLICKVALEHEDREKQIKILLNPKEDVKSIYGQVLINRVD